MMIMSRQHAARGSAALVLLLLLLITCLQIRLSSRHNDVGGGHSSAIERKSMRRGVLQQTAPHWEVPHAKCSKVFYSGEQPVFVTSYWKAHHHPQHTQEMISKTNEHRAHVIKNDPMCTTTLCTKHSICFLGACICHPGWHGDACDQKLEPANPWYTTNCPNLLMENTLDVSVPLNMTGGEYPLSSPNTCPATSVTKVCSYLCYSHHAYGTAVVPYSLWQAAQVAEGALGVKEGRDGLLNSQNDRSAEHFASFAHFASLSEGHELKMPKLGRVIEVGAGPWTQMKGILHARPDLIPGVASFTVWEPNAKRYMKAVSSCSYRSGDKLVRWDGQGTHTFPVIVQSDGGELLSNSTAYDTVISINVLEHVQDAFRYLTGLYQALKPGGVLIFHDRYYEDRAIIDGDQYHPVRIKRQVLDRFLSGFHVVFNNCSANYDNRVGEQGYYVIATKT